jgi:predicted phage terminase large subunit-like protein
MARLRFACFVQIINTEWVIPDFHITLCDYLQQENKLVVSMPPNHAKSTIASVLYPVWYIGNNPDKKILQACGSSNLASSFGLQIRRIMESEIYKLVFPESSIRRDMNSVTGLGVKQGGTMLIVSKGEKIGGLRADLVIFDDLVAGVKEAQSETMRRTAWDYLTSDLITRKNPNSKVFGIGTRWHQDDILCRIEAQKEGYFHDFRQVKFKAIDDFGNPLWPERFGLKDLNDFKISLGSKAFASLYQQEPVPDDGELIKKNWIQRFENLPPYFDFLIQAWDLAFTGNETSDYVACVIVGRAGSNYYVVDVFRKRMGFTETLKEFRAMADKHPTAFIKLVEEKANGSALIDSLKGVIGGIVPVNPTRDKITRINVVEPLFEAGNVHIRENRMGDELIDELVSFPNGANDDMVDALTYALTYLKGKSMMTLDNLGML